MAKKRLEDVAVCVYTNNFKGQYPDIAGMKPFDIAYDTSNRCIWQWTGRQWIVLMWMGGTKIALGAGNSIVEKIASTDSIIPNNVYCYAGNDKEVPADLRATVNDIAINHNLGNLMSAVSASYQDPLTGCWSNVSPANGECTTSTDGMWTVWRGFLPAVGQGAVVLHLIHNYQDNLGITAAGGGLVSDGVELSDMIFIKALEDNMKIDEYRNIVLQKYPIVAGTNGTEIVSTNGSIPITEDMLVDRKYKFTGNNLTFVLARPNMRPVQLAPSEIGEYYRVLDFGNVPLPTGSVLYF